MTTRRGPLARITAVIERIPRGRVATYGEIAALAGYPRAPRLVVYALKQCGPKVPWHRVIGRLNARHARVSIREPRSAALQRRLLTKEGVRFDPEGRVLLERYGWLGEVSETTSASSRTSPGRGRRRS